jgi:nicotinate-nucleotide--dimethylbenzimidazole phosphoribosyltransferase
MHEYENEIRSRILNMQRFNLDSIGRTRHRLNNLTMPLGSLGELENVLEQLSGITGKAVPSIQKPVAVIFAADHGVTEVSNVSAYEAKVTEEMVVNMCMGTSVSSVLARNEGAELVVVDVGVRTRVRHPKCMVRKVERGTQNMLKGPAMRKEQALQAVHIGISIADQLIDDGCDMLLVGEMGIGNTTASSAMAASLLDLPPAQVVGKGTGISDEQWQRKIQIVQRALEINQPNRDDPWDIISKLGGFEIAALAGAMLAAASRRVPIVLDGMITTVAALWSARLAPMIEDFMIASHQSAEPAHAYLLQTLRRKPLVNWNLRLGEGSGALFILPILRQACRCISETATFEDARVTNPHMKQLEQAEPRLFLDATFQKPSMSTGSGTPEFQTHEKAPVQLDFTEEEKRAVYKAILARRDIRTFLPDPIPQDVLERILFAAHHAPSVGYMQPWSFILIRDKTILKQLQREVEQERVKAAEHYQDLKKDYYLRLKVEGLTQAPLSICVTNDPNRGGPHVLGRNTIPETDLMSTSCAIENMWLAARAEGIAMGWVSIYRKEAVREILQIPEAVDPVAVLTLGYTPYFPEIPILERVGWGKRLDFQSIIHHERWNQSN